MTRSRASAKSAGTRFETVTATWLAARVGDDRIERRTRNGAHDRGDIGGVRTPLGDRVVIECKNYGGRILVSEWLREVAVEAGNDDAPVGVVVAKRRGVGDPGEQVVLMTVETFARLLVGS